MSRATVIIPTHNHGRLLLSAVRSVLRQTMQDFEIFIIGDGVTKETKEAVEEALTLDSRIRFFEHPKSPRTGEPYRHLALREATGKIACFLSDDDLWFPDHLEIFSHKLGDNDVIHSLPFAINPDGTVNTSMIDWSVREWVDWTLAGANRVGLSCVGFTLDFYRSLPHGWRTTPPGRWTDHYMWEQLLTMPGVRAAGTWRFTVLQFPASTRRDWTLEQKIAELEAWERKITKNPDGLRADVQRVLALNFHHLEIQTIAQANQLSDQADKIAEQANRQMVDQTLWNERMKNLPGFARNLLRWHWRRKGLWPRRNP